MSIEYWKPIVGFENYLISSFGRVKSLKRNIILKPGLVGEGYLQVCLCKHNVKYKFFIHRLVAEAFIPNPNNLPCVNHKDEVKTNNHVDNLEWCDYSYNNTYNAINKRGAAKRVNGKMAKPINQYDLNGVFLRSWPSTMEIERSLGIRNTYVSKCCLGYTQKTHGFIFRFAS